MLAMDVMLPIKAHFFHKYSSGREQIDIIRDCHRQVRKKQFKIATCGYLVLRRDISVNPLFSRRQLVGREGDRHTNPTQLTCHSGPQFFVKKFNSRQASAIALALVTMESLLVPILQPNCRSRLPA